MRTISLDTETFLIGPGAIAPKMVCYATCERLPNGELKRTILGNGDETVEASLRALFEDPEILLVLHEAAYDLVVISTTYPELEPLIWAKLEAGKITDTKIREQLLNLSTHGQLTSMFLPDGSAAQLSYSLSALTLKWLGIDTSHLKEGDDIWRLNYHTLDGLRADQYPRDAAEYALGDAQHTLQVYEEQERGKVAEGSTETEFFQTAVAFALKWITVNGMAVDAEKFAEVERMLREELSDSKLQPLVDAGVMRAATPDRPHAKQAKKVRELLLEWAGLENPTSEEILGWRTELMDAGVKFKDGEPSSIDQDSLKRRVMAVILSTHLGDSTDAYLGMTLDEQIATAIECGVDFKRTDAGKVSADSEVIEEYADDDPVLACYKHRQSLQKIVSTEMPRMQWEGKVAKLVHWPFKVLLETGRTSSSADSLFPSGNGQQIHPKVRPCFVPRNPDGLLCSTDYSTLELATVAQVTYAKFGYSVHRDKINDGYDLHAYLGSALARRLSPVFRKLLVEAGIGDDRDDTYLLFKSLEDNPDWKKFYKHWRKFAKPIGLGFPGGLGPFKILTLAKKSYGVNIVEEAEKLFADSPEEFDRANPSVRYWAEKLYKWKKDNDNWTPTLKGIALAAMLRQEWFDTYPEMRQYLKEYLGAKRKKVVTSIDDPDIDSTSYNYTSPFGMVRANCTYTAAANGEAMQTPAAEGFKAAVFNLVRETRVGSLKGKALVVNEIHDETITEILHEEDAHDVAMEVRRIMEESMKLIVTDVKIKAQPCLMRRWMKEAEPVYKDDRLVPWEPVAAKA